jgi:hypothetical protein
MGKHRKNWTLNQLRDERVRLLGMFSEAKTTYLKDNLYHKIKSVNRDLFTITKETKYQ